MSPVTSRPRLSARVAGLAAAGVVAVLALTGCIKVDADVTVNSDALGSGTLSFELQKEAANFLGISDLDTFQSQLTEGDLSDSGLGALSGCETSESDTGYVYSCSFTDQAFSEPVGIWTIAKEGDLIVFRMVNEGQSGTEGSDAAALLGDASMGSINVTVTFPGPITEITGDAVEKTSDTSATISGTMTTALNVTITSESGSSALSLSSLLVVLVGLGVVVLIVVVIIVLIMRRRRPAETADDAGDATAAGAVSTEGTAGEDAPNAEAATVVAVEAMAVEETAPETGAVVEETVVEETVVEETAPETGAVAEETVVEETVVEETAPETGAVAEETVVEETAPGEPEPPTA